MSSLADETRWMDATDQASLVAKGEVAPGELLEAAIERIERSNPSLNAVVIEWFDHARSVAADPKLPKGPFRGVPFLLHYVTSKGAIVALTRSLARELGSDGIHVNCVAPGFTMSDGVRQHPEVIDALRDVSVSARTIQRDQVPEDVVGAVVFLCTPAADFVTGQTMVIDGGQYFH